MVEWRLLDPQAVEAEWSSWVASSRDASPFQTYAWGEYKRPQGWRPERWLARDAGGRAVCGLQALTKALPFGRRLVWIPGGPLVGGAEQPMATAPIGPWMTAWREQIRQQHRLAYVRFFSCAPSSPAQADAMTQGWARPSRPISSGRTIQVELSASLEQLRAGMTAKHRYYVKQSEAAGLTWTVGSSAALTAGLADVCRDMSIAKGLRRSGVGDTTLQPLQQAFGDRCLMLVGYRQQRPVTACLVLMTAGHAFYLMAATGAAGRAVSASYAMIFRLFEALKARGITRFDFGGLAPNVPRLAGVNHFKRGFGGELVEYCGEWEWAPHPFYRLGVNACIRLGGIASS